MTPRERYMLIIDVSRMFYKIASIILFISTITFYVDLQYSLTIAVKT